MTLTANWRYVVRVSLKRQFYECIFLLSIQMTIAECSAIAFTLSLNFQGICVVIAEE